MPRWALLEAAPAERCGAWGSNPPDPARRAGALPESELRVRRALGGRALVGSQERTCTSMSRWTPRSERGAYSIPPPGQERIDLEEAFVWATVGRRVRRSAARC